MTDASVEARRPGRPRSAECDRAILEAALEEYAERGFDGLSVDAVAARAGVSKATIYRRYPSKLELVITAAYVVADEDSPKPDTGTLRGDLVVALRNLCRKMNDTVLGRTIRTVIGDSTRNAELNEMHQEFVRSRRRGTVDLLQRAMARGELRPDTDLEVATDMVGGPLFYRHVVSGMPIDDDYVDHVVDAFIRAYGT